MLKTSHIYWSFVETVLLGEGGSFRYLPHVKINYFSFRQMSKRTEAITEKAKHGMAAANISAMKAPPRKTSTWPIRNAISPDLSIPGLSLEWATYIVTTPIMATVNPQNIRIHPNTVGIPLNIDWTLIKTFFPASSSKESHLFIKQVSEQVHNIIAIRNLTPRLRLLQKGLLVHRCHSDCSPHLYRWEVPVMKYHLDSPRQVADAGRPGALRVSLPPPGGHSVCYSLIYIRVFNPHW